MLSQEELRDLGALAQRINFYGGPFSGDGLIISTEPPRNRVWYLVLGRPPWRFMRVGLNKGNY